MKQLFLVVAVSMLATGCASTELNKRVEIDADRHIQTAHESVKKIKPDTIPLLMESSDDVFVAAKTVDISEADKLPAQFQKKITYEDTATLMEAAEFIIAETGIQTKVDRDLIGSASDTSSSMSAGSPIRLSFKNKPLIGLLNALSARYGVSWRYESGTIHFFLLTTRTFALNALPGTSTLTASVTNQSASASGQTAVTTTGTSSGSAQNTVQASTLAVWSSVEKIIKDALSTKGKVSISPETGTVTVTDTPEYVDRVARIVDMQNKKLGAQAYFNVRVLSVSRSDADEYGINWNAVFNQTAGSLGFTLKNAFTAANDASKLDLKVLATATNSLVAPWAGSDAMISALSKEGKVTVLTSFDTWTLNNQPVPVQVVKQKGYLQSVTSTQTQGVGTSATLTPGVITTGISMNLLPHIMDNGKILLQYAIDLSNLVDISTVTSAGNTIQTPEVDTRNFLQRVSLNSGETLVISGFEQNTNSLNNSGVGKPTNSWFGGGTKASQGRDVLVVTITPIVSQGN